MSAPKIELYPTPARKKLAADIEAGEVRWYWWREPWACHVPTNGKVTSRVREMERAGLVRIFEAREVWPDCYTLVLLTDEGREWAGIDHPAEGGEPKATLNSSSDLGGDAA